MNTTNVIENSRKYHIDLIENIAILFVIMYHSSNYNINLLTGDIQFPPAASYWFRTILSTCVPLFFFANGYLIFNKDFSLRKHIAKIIKLIILTVLWGGIVLIALSIIKNEIWTLKEFLKALWTWKQGWINHLWFMGALICIYIIFPLLKFVFDNNKKLFYYFGIITFLMTFGNNLLDNIATIFAGIFLDKNREITTNFFNMFNPFRGIYGYAFVYFCIGGILHNYVNCIRKRQKYFNICAIVSILTSMTFLFLFGLFVSTISGKMWDVVWDGYDTIFTLTNVVAIFILSLNYNEKNYITNKILKFISINTIGIYFLHEIFIHATINNLRQIPFMSNIFGNFIYALFIIILCLITIILIKKLPIIKNLL